MVGSICASDESMKISLNINGKFYWLNNLFWHVEAVFKIYVIDSMKSYLLNILIKYFYAISLNIKIKTFYFSLSPWIKFGL